MSVARPTGMSLPAFAQALHVEQAGAEEGVRGRAVRDTGTARAKGGPLALGQVDGVAEIRAGTGQAIALIDAEIIGRLGEERAHPGDFIVVFADMGLHQCRRMLAPKHARRFELFRRRCRGKTRSDRIGQPSALVPAFDERLRLVVAALSRVPQPLRRIAVHHHLARRHAQTALLGAGEKRVHRLRMDGAVDRRRRGAVAQALIEKMLGYRARIVRVREFQLRREGVAVQPVEKLLAIGGDHLALRIVDMAVDEARHDQVGRVVIDGDAGMFRQHVGRRPGLDDGPVFHHHRAVRIEEDRIAAARPETDHRERRASVRVWRILWRRDPSRMHFARCLPMTPSPSARG